jgi:flavin reductase (DIM6/NTAB) family NADH-FMN oxidoreductase RutF
MNLSALFKLSYGLYVVGVKTEKGLGGCIVDAVGQVSAGEKPVVMLSSMKRNYTNECIKKTGEFSLSVLPADTDPFIIGNFGFQSARDQNKWDNAPHTVKNGLPVLLNACSYLHCRVKDSTEFETHTMFLCELADADLGQSGSKPLIFGDYQAGMKGAAMDAFQKFKETGKPPSMF